VFPGCTDYRGNSDSDWAGAGGWCQTTIENFDSNHTLPQNIGDAARPLYYFKPKAGSPKAYILYIPPNGNLPTNKDQGRYEYFLFQVRCGWIAQHRLDCFRAERKFRTFI
jgi:hypothetical protein